MQLEATFVTTVSYSIRMLWLLGRRPLSMLRADSGMLEIEGESGAVVAVQSCVSSRTVYGETRSIAHDRSAGIKQCS